MTRQLDDNLWLDGAETFVPPFIPLPKVIWDTMLAEPRGRSVHSTACLRGYIATWELYEGMLYLCSIASNRFVMGPEPIAATHFSGILELVEPRAGFAPRVCGPDCEACQTESDDRTALELEIASGRLVRARHLVEPPQDLPWWGRSRARTMPFATVMQWRWAPEWIALGAQCSNRGPFDTAPRWHELQLGRLRARVKEERTRREWDHETLARAAGLDPAHARKIAAFEDGPAQYDSLADWAKKDAIAGADIDAVTHALKMSPDELEELRVAGAVAFADACKAWQAEPHDDVVVDESVLPHARTYRVPPEARDDLDASIAWAKRAAQASWRSVSLVFRRHTVIDFDGYGVETGRSDVSECLRLGRWR